MFLVPLVAVLLPALRIVPGLLQWRAKSRVFRWYGEIKYLENELLDDPRPDRVAEMLERLDEIEQGVTRTPVPRAYADYAYNLRMHVEFVRQQVLRGVRARPASETDAADAGSAQKG